MKMKKITALCLAASTLLATSTAMAWESEDGVWSTSANVALSSEYMWRGVGQSASDPAISGGFDVSHSSGLYAGIWASNVDFGSDASAEVDYYAGFGGDFGDSGISYDIGGLFYDYPSEDELDFFEAYGFISYSFLTAGVSYSLDAFGAADNSEDNLYYQLDAAYDVGSVTLAAGVGRYDFDLASSTDYTNWYIGASAELAGFGLDVTYHDTNLDGSDSDAVVFTISKSM